MFLSMSYYIVLRCPQPVTQKLKKCHMGRLRCQWIRWLSPPHSHPKPGVLGKKKKTKSRVRTRYRGCLMSFASPFTWFKSHNIAVFNGLPFQSASANSTCKHCPFAGRNLSHHSYDSQTFTAMPQCRNAELCIERWPCHAMPLQSPQT